MLAIRSVYASNNNQRAVYSAGIPVNIIKPISELVVYYLLDGANEVPASASERADGIVHRFGLGAQMKTGLC